MTQPPNPHYEPDPQDDTQPRPIQGLPVTPQQGTYASDYPGEKNAPRNVQAYDEEEEGDGPGCFIWGLVGTFSLGLALAFVLLAALAGWSDGVRVASSNATATQRAEIGVQCQRIPLDLNENRLALAQARFDNLAGLTPAPACIAELAPLATSAWLASQPTSTPTGTPTSTPTATPEDLPTATATATPPPTSDAALASGYDLAGLLAEARQLLANGETRRAIDTLEAIAAIDPTYDKSTIDNLLFNALTSEARRIYLAGNNLAEANLLVTRAEEYGDVRELGYERFIAGLYLEAQVHRNIDFRRAISLLNQIVVVQGLTNYRDARSLLIGQLNQYGDALVASGSYCLAVEQYDQSLSLQASPTISEKRGNASIACATGVPTPDPDAPTPDPALPPPTETPGVAPIGVPGT